MFHKHMKNMRENRLFVAAIATAKSRQTLPGRSLTLFSRLLCNRPLVAGGPSGPTAHQIGCGSAEGLIQWWSEEARHE